MKRNLLLFSLFLLFAGCLNFGKDVTLSGKEVDGTVLADVTKLTGVTFPDGTMGKEYLYFGSGIDDALVIKVSIPRDKKEEFFENAIFAAGRDEEPYINLGQGRSWWNVKSLAAPIHTIYDFPNGDMIECSVGEESGETIVYLSWITV
ncbi:MAG: hypothetical protein K8S27_06785 [Candidatus Omnitrophica bacterium]|nr:hypothetical protein [Candidatus Omnitrophota bacterium]